jgi:short-subunit dehydrogenase
MAPYNVSKAAVVALTETTVQELAGSGVEVSVLCPGFFPTRVVEDGVREGRIDPAEARTARALMDFSRHQASDIARIALDGAERGTLYIIPHQEVRLLWLLKRLMPTTYVRTLVPLTWGRARQMAARSAAAAERST